VLVPWYELTRDELPDCWALHAPVVVELSWLRTTYVQAYHRRCCVGESGTDRRPSRPGFSNCDGELAEDRLESAA
jgi:hypothetical protein